MPFMKRNRWPDPQESTGVYLATIGRDKLGRDSCCWEAKGKARAVFNTLQNDIGQYINQTCESLPKDVVWSLYMVGRKRETANPTITFISCELGPRQKLRTLIKESTLLDKYPGFITMDIDRPPGCRSSVIKTLGGLHESELISKDAQLQQISLSFPFSCFMGASIFLKDRGQNLVATGGGLVQCNGKVFMTSVAHPFEKFWTDRFPETMPERDYIFDIDETSDSDEEDEKLVDVTSLGSKTSPAPSGASDCSLSTRSDLCPSSPLLLGPFTPPTTKPSINPAPILAPSNAIPVPSRANNQRYRDFWNDVADTGHDRNNTQITELNHDQRPYVTMAAPNITHSANLPQTCDVSGPTITSAKEGTLSLDYTLFELPDSIVKELWSTALRNNLQKTPTSVPREPRSTEVVVHTTSGPVAGRLLATPSFMQPAQGMLPQQLWTVLIEGTFQSGVCGSWVVDLSTGDVLGHIIAGALEDGFAYIIPFCEILDDLNLHFGDGWALADPTNQSTGIDAGDNMLPQVQQCSPTQVAVSRGSSQIGCHEKKCQNTHFANSQCREFCMPRRISDEQRPAQTGKKLDTDGDDSGTFLIDFWDTTARLEVEVLKRFCRGTSLKDCKTGKGLAGTQRALWLDERNSFPDPEGSGITRQYENPLTATGAFRVLEQLRFNHRKLPAAGGRLIYVADLSPAYIYALAATASPLHARTLQNAIYKYLAFQPSISAKIPSAECLTFQLELHLPFFILKKSTPPTKAHNNKRPYRSWTDLSFLRLDTFDFDIQPTEPNEVWSIQEAQISCVVTESDHLRWIGYGFVDAAVDGLRADSSGSSIGFDQIATEEIESKFPIWEPREYWIKVFEIRIRRIENEYQYMIHKLEFVVTQYINSHPSALSQRPGTAQDQTTEMKVAFDWALQIIDILQKPHDVLLATVKAWRAFNSDNEKIEYFNEHPVTESIMPRHRSIQEIKASFIQLDEYLEKIVALTKKCSDYQKALKFRLTLDKKEAADKNQFTTFFTLLFLYPVALAAAIFSMQQEVVPFTQSPRSFLLTVVILMIMVYVTQLFGHYTLPSLQKTIARWIERGESENEEVTLTDEERVTPKTLKEKSGLLSWSASWGTTRTGSTIG